VSWCMQIDRFLVLQHEGDLHTPTHPEPSAIIPNGRTSRYR
jgi:hypothetical protein